MREHCDLGWVVAGFILLAMASCVLGVAGCGSSSAPSSASTAQSPAPPTLSSTWAKVGRLGDQLVGLVVQSSVGLSEPERKYLVRSNVAWQNIQRTCADCSAATEASATVPAVKALAQTVTSTTALWLRMKAPSARFASFHKQVQALMSRLNTMAKLTEKHELAASESERDDLAGRLATSGATIAALADQAAAKGESLREKYGRNPLFNAPTGDLTAAERAQIEAIVQGSMWITEPLNEAMGYLSTPMPSWSYAVQFSFCLDMGFIQAECDNWINAPAAGPTIAYSYEQYVTGLRILRRAAGQLITAAENLDMDAGYDGAASLQEATPYVTRAIQGFRSLLPSAFSN